MIGLPRSRPQRVAHLVLASLASLVLSTAVLPVASGHGPDPLVGGALWAQNQAVKFRWLGGQVPPAFMQTPIKAAATDSNESRASKAATFTYDAGGSSWISYGENVGCGVNGIACFSRANAPDSFSMSFREQGHRFDWGSLKWCQFYSAPPDGCFDVENIALDEFGHAQILGHHVNFDDESDYGDAVVQTVSRSKPRALYNKHTFGRCDVATLQREYDVPSSSSKISTCLDLDTELGITPSATWVTWGGTVKFTADLGVVDLAEYDRLGGNALSNRIVTLQTRALGSTTWTTFGTMPAGSAAGTYVLSVGGLKASADWRARFATPSSEGLNGSTSPVVRVSVSSCSTPPCPMVVSGGTSR